MPKQKIFLIVALVAFTLFPFVSLGAGLVPCGGPSDPGPCTVQDFFFMVARVVNWLIMMAGVYATYVIIGAAFWMIVAGGDEEKITQKKQALSNAVVGLTLAMMAFLFINTAVNWLLKSKCAIDLRNPLTYLVIKDYSTDPSCQRAAEFK